MLLVPIAVVLPSAYFGQTPCGTLEEKAAVIQDALNVPVCAWSISDVDLRDRHLKAHLKLLDVCAGLSSEDRILMPALRDVVARHGGSCAGQISLACMQLLHLLGESDQYFYGLLEGEEGPTYAYGVACILAQRPSDRGLRVLREFQSTHQRGIVAGRDRLASKVKTLATILHDEESVRSLTSTRAKIDYVTRYTSSCYSPAGLGSMPRGWSMGGIDQMLSPQEVWGRRTLRPPASG
jgi:hypothetical protein